MGTRIFQIGFNKCGTRSISHFFKRHGLSAADWERGQLAQSIKADLANGMRPLSDWDHVDVFTDMEYVHGVNMIEGYRYFRALHSHYPDAVFILNTRNGEAWVRSRHAHGSGAYTDSYKRYYGYDTEDEVFWRWRREWYAHHLDVLAYFSEQASGQLFVWDIDNPDFQSLQEMVPFELNLDFWTQRGKT